MMTSCFKIIVCLLSFLLIVSLIGCVGKQQKPVDYSLIFDNYDAVLQRAERIGEYGDTAYECHIDPTLEKQSFYFGRDEKGNVTNNLTLFKTADGYEFSFDGGLSVGISANLIGADAIKTGAPNDRHIVLMKTLDETFVYDCAGDAPEFVLRLPGCSQGYTDGTLLVERRAEVGARTDIDIYELGNADIFVKRASVIGGDVQGDAFITTADVNAFSRIGAAAKKAYRH